MKLLHTISLPKVGKKLISKSKLFSYIDGDFKNWGLDATTTSQKQNLSVYELTEDMTFEQIFPIPEKMFLTQGQILSFIEKHKDKLRTGGYATFFLFRSKGKFFVALVHVVGGGALRVSVGRLENGGLWDAQYRHRVVIPQLDDSLSLEPSNTLPTELTINGVKYIKSKKVELYFNSLK